MITDETKQKIWDEIVEAENFLAPILPHERTKAMLIREYNLTKWQVEILIRNLREQGRLQERDALTVDRRRCIAYSISDEGSFNSS